MDLFLVLKFDNASRFFVCWEPNTCSMDTLFCLTYSKQRQTYLIQEKMLKFTLLFAVQVVILWQTVYVVTAFCLWGAVQHLQRLTPAVYMLSQIQNSTLKNTEPSLYTTTWMCQNIHTPKCRPKCTNMEIPVYIFLSHIQLFTEK